MKKIDAIMVHDYVKTRWIDWYQQHDTGDDSDLQLLCSSILMCMVDWCDDKYDFFPTDILSPRAEKCLGDKIVKKGFKRFTQTVSVPYYRKIKVHHVLMTVFIHSHCHIPTSAPIGLNINIPNQEM